MFVSQDYIEMFSLSLLNVVWYLQTVAPWERRSFPLPEDPAPEPESESDHHIRPRMRSISGCRAATYGRLDSDEMELPCDDDGSGPKHKAPTHR